MGKRSTGRKLAMQALYEAEAAQVDIEKALADIFASEEACPKETKEFARLLAEGAFNDIKNIDKEIKKYSKDWSIERISLVDKSILRMAIFELKDQVNPVSIVIDEAIELSKKFSSNEAKKFINGILSAYVKKSKNT